MSDKPFGPSSTFGKARRREAYRRLADVVRRRKPKPLLDLDDVGKRLRVFEQSYVGIRLPSEAGWRPTRPCELRETRAGSRRR